MAGILGKVFHKNQSTNSGHVPGSFSLGVTAIPKAFDADELVVEGFVNGTIKPGMVVNITNLGDDHRKAYVATVIDIEVKQKQVHKASNCLVSVRVNNPGDIRIKPGTLLFTDDSTKNEQRVSYNLALEDYYILKKKILLTDEDFNRMSITDLAEVLRIYLTKHSSGNATSDKILNQLNTVLAQKIIQAEELYVVWNRDTGEPHMFSELVNQYNDVFDCSPPKILLVTEAFLPFYTDKYKRPVYELVKIDQEESGEGITDNLGLYFYLNGVCGVNVLSDSVTLEAEQLVPKPDFSKIPENKVPIINPDLVKWLLLAGQLEKSTKEDKDIYLTIYNKYLKRALLKTKFLVPLKSGSPAPEISDNGNVLLTQTVKDNVATSIGKYDKESLRIYTDWKRLLTEYDSSWSAFVQPLSALIHEYDCAVNVTLYTPASYYITEELYDEIINEIINE